MDSMFLRTIPHFDELDADELETVWGYVFKHELPKGKTLFSEGSHGTAFCFLAFGELEVWKQGENGERVNIARLTPGDSAGEMAMVDGLVRSATVEAAERSTVLVIKREQFQKLLQDEPRLSARLLIGIARMLSINLRKTSTELTKLMLPIT